ncbi:MAG TPA: c-type cytochrome domain-containing protein [Terracidiphilus sp.]|nr:c-type cytochrome domain-containing protein [Terracidiphilus sp.]
MLPSKQSTRIGWAASLGFSLLLLSLPWLVRLDGHPNADWQQFLGRFHPLAVHIPIGLLVLVPLLEMAGAVRPGLREAAGFVLALAFVSCLLALSLGFLLAYGGGVSGAGVTRHLWGGIVLTIFVLVCLWARPQWNAHSASYAYPALLACMLIALLWTAHQGGSITYGGNYLTQFMPAGMKRMLALGAAPSSASFYERHVHPILDSNCASCHGEAQAKGGLRMDSFESLMKGGKDGPVIVSGSSATSVLFRRITLPPDHKQFMPAEGRPPLQPEEIAWIKAWIDQGASPTLTRLAGVTIREDLPEIPSEPVGDYSTLMPEIQRMQQGQGAKLKQVSATPSDGLILFTVDAASTFDDARLAQFQKFAPYIVEAELGRTAVTDASFDTLKQFTHLRALHLEETKITGAGLPKLASLSQLSYLNLSGTQVTSASGASLSALKSLRRVYLYHTPAQPAPAASGAAQPKEQSGNEN